MEIFTTTVAAGERQDHTLVDTKPVTAPLMHFSNVCLYKNILPQRQSPDTT
jgi:hypothetical protein